MPEIVDKLTKPEEEIVTALRNEFTEEQMCAYFLTKTIRSQYQFDDEFIADWYEKIFDQKPKVAGNARRELVQAYTEMLMIERKYEFHLKYWIRQYQENLITEMKSFFGGDPGK